jgi:drug/metabolite transporter (DMT)-like permease
MSAIAVGLVIISALLHASWNMLAKRSADPLAFIFAFNVVSLVVFAIPAGIVLVQHPIPRDGWPFIFATGTLHVVYMLCLAAAYRHGALSLTYPIARGVGVLLVPILAVPLLNEQPTTAGVTGIAAILVGLVAMALPGRTLKPPAVTGNPRKGMLFALITGLTIAAYSIVDKQGVARVHPMVYVYAIFLLATVGLAPIVLSQRLDAVKNEWNTNRMAVLAGGVLPLGTYLIILLAMRIAAVSYIVPLRETSILFSTLLGALVLKEHVSRLRIIASAFIAAGVLTIAIGG